MRIYPYNDLFKNVLKINGLLATFSIVLTDIILYFVAVIAWIQYLKRRPITWITSGSIVSCSLQVELCEVMCY